jgi:RimJ/RimL family protein N-acetyltransferase
MTDNFSIGKEISAVVKTVRGWLSLAFAGSAEPEENVRLIPLTPLTRIFNDIVNSTLRTERLELRPWHKRDAKAIADFLNRDDGAFQEFYSAGCQKQHYTKVQVKDTMVGTLRDNLTLSHPIFLKGTDKIIGAMGWWEDHRGRPRLSYFISQSERGQGYAFEAYNAEFNEFARRGIVDEMVAEVALDNLPSLKLLRRLGFRAEGTVEAIEGSLAGKDVVFLRRDLSAPTVH